MQPLSFPGTLEDTAGREDLVWQIRPSLRPGNEGRYEVESQIRGVAVWGVDFDGLEPSSSGDDASRARLPLNRAGEVSECVLTGELPCTADGADQRLAITVNFRLDLRDVQGRDPGKPMSLHLSATVAGIDYAIDDDWFEDGTLRLDQAMQPAHRLRCCVTCLFSDYSPGGHGLMGIRCHRDARDQYLSVRSKTEYWSVPVTEEVPEIYLCDQYQQRVPGTGYRG